MNDATERDDPAGDTTTPVTAGRPLDERGRPTGGPALALDPSGPAADLFEASPHPLVSDPASRTWAALLATPGDDGVDRPHLLQWLAPDADVPPAHVHPTTETFEAVEGRPTVVVDGDPVRLDPGASTTVDPEVEHTFRNDTEEVVAFRAELPSMLTVRGLYTVWGATHEAATAEDRERGRFGGPGALRALLVSQDLFPETTMTAAPRTLQRGIWATVGRVARAAGLDGADDRFLEDRFWERRVEQPDLGGGN